MSVIEETKYLSSFSIRELMSSLQSFSHRLDRHAKYSVECAFQALTMDVKGREQSPSSSQQSKPNYSAKQKLERKESEFQMERKFSEEFLCRAIFQTRKLQNL